MAVDLLLFVSKRVSAVAAALLCLVAVHLVSQVPAARTASATEVRVAIGAAPMARPAR